MNLNVTSNLVRIGWVCVGVLLAYALRPYRQVSYPEVIVPAARIIEREMPFTAPGPWDLGTRIRYVYVQPDVRAVAPGAVIEDVARFCRPVVVAQNGGVAQDVQHPTPSVIRSVSYTPSGIPMRKGALLVTSMDGYGNLTGEDYTVRAPFGIAAGLEPPFNTVVRYSRFAPFREIAGGFLWYGAFRLVEAVVR